MGSKSRNESWQKTSLVELYDKNYCFNKKNGIFLTIRALGLTPKYKKKNKYSV